MFRLPGLFGSLALEIWGRSERRVRLEGVELCADERVLFGQIRLQCFDVCELIGEVLRCDGVLDQSVGDGFGVGGVRVECDGGGGECGQGLRARGGEAGD